jgi:predicted O-methyltransferase YrrM
MDQAVKAVLAEYDRRRAAEERAQQAAGPEGYARLDDWLLPVGPDTAQLLQILIRSTGAKSILEIGTSYGYSTLWLADAARAVNGRVTTLEVADYKSAYASEALGRAGLSQYVDFRVGNALEILPRLAEPFDFVLLDLWKDLYLPSLELFYPRLSSNALVVADNMIMPENSRPHADAYRRRVRELEFDTVLLPVGSGVELSRRR